MAKRKEEKVTPEGIRRAMELDQDKINAALADAVLSPDGSRPMARPNEPAPGKVNKEKKENLDVKGSDECKNNEPIDAEMDKSMEDDEDFGRKCFNLDIDAKTCNCQSRKSNDKSIDEFLRGINKKIYNETKVGGFSTNIQFRVAPNDYVNVNHIIDWYRIRGFEVMNYETTTAPYGNGAGMIQYNFTISWATPA